MIKLYREILFSIIRLLFSLLSLNFLIMEIILKIFIPVYSVFLLIDKVLILNILNSKTLIKDSINLLLYVIQQRVLILVCFLILCSSLIHLLMLLIQRHGLISS